MSNHADKNNEALLAAMEKLKKSNTQENIENFEDILLKGAVFYIPVKMAGEGENTRPAFGVIADKEKHHYYTVFTSKEAMRTFKGEKNIGKYQYTRCTFDTIGRTAMGDPRISGIVINAGTDNMIVARQLISDVLLMYQAKDHYMNVVEADKDVKLDAPTGNYSEMVDALKDWMRQDPNVSAAYLRQITRNGVDIWVIIVSHIRKTEPTFGNIMHVARDFSGGHEVALLSSRSKAGENAIADIMPFYRKPFTLIEDRTPME
ncbi:enhanced serine sensitivity protein SseB C-terminal domain-containing protein [Oribacterium sp. HCP28S3_H8]|uniref:enhanced serine sensitivity protein SseB C-terminal domain-containing protein n=1 Tax=Oribacterium sp. HCP28S3_H8 TaxID=3438945 RepID=UPI003F8C1908